MHMTMFIVEAAKTGEHADSQPDTAQYIAAQQKLAACLFSAAKLMAEAFRLLS
jgi:hypothetical protein